MVTTLCQEQYEEGMSISERLILSIYATYPPHGAEDHRYPLCTKYGSQLEANVIFELTEASRSDNALHAFVDPVTSHQNTKVF